MTNHKCKKLSNDTFDAITAVFLIAVVVAGVCYWLAGMPS
jgi:hypothetical protein